FLKTNMSIFHLATIAFETYRSRGGDFVCSLQHLPIASAICGVTLDRDHNFVPILGFIILEVFVRSSERIIATLKLRFANEYATVRIGCGSKLQFQNKVFRKFLSGP